MKDLSRDEIEHEIFQEQLKGIIAQTEANFQVMAMTLETIKETGIRTLKQAEITNGRVTELEKETAIIRLFKKHKYVLALVLIGFFKIYEMIPLNELFNKLLKLIF